MMEIIMFSSPTEKHFTYYWKKAQELGWTQDKFEKEWFAAYNKMLERQAEDLLRKNYWNLVGVVVKNGNAEQKEAMKKIIDKGIATLEKRYGIDLKRDGEKGDF